MRLLSVLLLMALLINACTNAEKEEEQPQITENQTEIVRSMPDEAATEAAEEEEIIELEEEAKEKVEVKEIVKVETKAKAVETQEGTASKKVSISNNITATGTVKLNTMLISSVEMAALAAKQEEEDRSVGQMLALLAQKLEALEDDDDGIQGFVDANATNTVDTLQAASFEDSLALGTGKMAQTTANGKQVKVGAFNEIIAESRSIDIDEQVMATGNGATSYTQLEYMRRPKLLKDFTGYKIELVTVYNKSLPLTDDLFKAFGGLSFKEKSENSTTYYLGEFPSKKALEDYLAKVVQPRFSKAKGVKLENGIEVEYE